MHHYIWYYGVHSAVKETNMEFAGIQKLTLLDFPGTVACTLFTAGCDFRCPFCQNASLVRPSLDAVQPLTEEEVLRFLRSRTGILDGVAVTGGEPLLHAEALIPFLRAVKAMGYRVKLDTNGAHPTSLRALLEAGLVDHVAVDIKSSRSGYAKAIGCAVAPLARIEQTLALLMQGDYSYEFRTTVVEGLHTEEDLRDIAQWIAGPEPYFLQQYRDSGEILSPDGLTAPTEEEMRRYVEIVRPFVPNVQIRGI